MGRVSTTQDYGNDHTEGGLDYAPLYTYYSYEKRDPVEHFFIQLNES